MTQAEKRNAKGRLDERLATSGFRFTPQREHVYGILSGERDHPTAEQVFIRAKKRMPEISMATVYNCLDALVKSGLVRQVHVDRGASRFCPNMHEHGHFTCEACGAVYDIDFDKRQTGIPLPRGFKASVYEVSIRGLCPDCSSRDRASG